MVMPTYVDCDSTMVFSDMKQNSCTVEYQLSGLNQTVFKQQQPDIPLSSSPTLNSLLHQASQKREGNLIQKKMKDSLQK